MLVIYTQKLLEHHITARNINIHNRTSNMPCEAMAHSQQVLWPVAPVALLIIHFSSTSSNSFLSISIQLTFFARCFAVALDVAGVLDAMDIFGAVLGACLPVAAGPQLQVCGALDLVFMIGVLGVDADGCGWMRVKRCGCHHYR